MLGGCKLVRSANLHSSKTLTLIFFTLSRIRGVGVGVSFPKRCALYPHGSLHTIKVVEIL